MTKHIADQIETIIHKGGFVIVNLRTLVDVLEDIRSVESINREFQEAFEDIEKEEERFIQLQKKNCLDI